MSSTVFHEQYISIPKIPAAKNDLTAASVIDQAFFFFWQSAGFLLRKFGDGKCYPCEPFPRRLRFSPPPPQSPWRMGPTYRRKEDITYCTVANVIDMLSLWTVSKTSEVLATATAISLNTLIRVDVKRTLPYGRNCFFGQVTQYEIASINASSSVCAAAWMGSVLRSLHLIWIESETRYEWISRNSSLSRMILNLPVCGPCLS